MKSITKKIIIIVFIILLLLGSIFFINRQRQLDYINNSDLLIEANYQNGFSISETSIYAISEKNCIKITIPVNLQEYQSNNNSIKSYEYSIKYSNDMNNGYQISSYTDPELNQIDENIVNKIVLDAKNNHNNLNRNYSNPNYNKDVNIINNATLTCFENSDYYHISIGYNENDNENNENNSDVYTVVNEMIYKGEKYIDELLIHGTIKSVISIKK